MDIDSLPSNSHKSREKQYHLPEKKVEPVVTGKTTLKKKSGIVKLADVFLPEDVSSVKEYIIRDVIIPKVAWDSFWGISGRSSSGKSIARYVSYDKCSQNKRSDPPRRSGVSFEDIEFNSRGDAEIVYDRMAELCDQYNAVSVADMYELANVSNDNFVLAKIGWTSMEGAEVVRVPGGAFKIKMPMAHPFD